METKEYTRKEFLSYLATYQDTMMSKNKPVFMLVYMALQTDADTNIVLKKVDFADICMDLELHYGEITFITIDNVTLQKSIA
jgi:hypothetical protein